MDDHRTAISRRGVLKAAAALGALAPHGLTVAAFAQSGFDWKRFKGEHLEVSHTLGPRGALLQKYEKEFQELTGISVGSEQVPEQQHRQKERASERKARLHAQHRILRVRHFRKYCLGIIRLMRPPLT